MQMDFNDPVYREKAIQYDEEVRAYCSYGHEVIFGMSFEVVRPSEKLLDIGIGTGLASIHFSKVGLKVYGLDNSLEMLAACQSKLFAEERLKPRLHADPRNTAFHWRSWNVVDAATTMDRYRFSEGRVDIIHDYLF